LLVILFSTAISAVSFDKAIIIPEHFLFVCGGGNPHKKADFFVSDRFCEKKGFSPMRGMCDPPLKW
jgi:hypothetical protein